MTIYHCPTIKRSKEGNTISHLFDITIRHDAMCSVTIMFFHQGLQDIIPPCRRGQSKQQHETVEEGFKVSHVVQGVSMSHLSEQTHPQDSIHEHKDEEEHADVQEGWDGDD